MTAETEAIAALETPQSTKEEANVTAVSAPETPTTGGPADNAKEDESASVNVNVENEAAGDASKREDAAASCPSATTTGEAESAGTALADSVVTATTSTPGTLTDALANDIKSLMEFYFGAANWRRDKFLQGEAAKDPEGYVPLTVFLKCNKLKKLTSDPAVVVQALEREPVSSLLSLRGDKAAVKRTVALALATEGEEGKDDSDRRTLFVDGIPKIPVDGAKEVTVDDIVAIFKALGPVDFVRLSRDKTSKKLTGAAFVEFPNVADAQRVLAVEWKSRPIPTLGGKTNVILRVRQYERDYKNKVAAAQGGATVGSKRKAPEGDGGEEKKGGVYDFELPENFEKELATLVPRHVKFTGIKSGTQYYELREFFNKYGAVKYVTYQPDSDVALVKFLTAETAAKFLGDTPEVSDVVFKEGKLGVVAPTEAEVREQLTAKNARKRSNLETRGQARREGGKGRGGGGKRGRGAGGRGRK